MQIQHQANESQPTRNGITINTENNIEKPPKKHKPTKAYATVISPSESKKSSLVAYHQTSLLYMKNNFSLLGDHDNAKTIEPAAHYVGP
jgi:hypothetical protein